MELQLKNQLLRPHKLNDLFLRPSRFDFLPPHGSFYLLCLLVMIAMFKIIISSDHMMAPRACLINMYMYLYVCMCIVPKDGILCTLPDI